MKSGYIKRRDNVFLARLPKDQESHAETEAHPTNNTSSNEVKIKRYFWVCTRNRLKEMQICGCMKHASCEACVLVYDPSTPNWKVCTSIRPLFIPLRAWRYFNWSYTEVMERTCTVRCGTRTCWSNICVLSIPSLRRQYTPKDRILATLLRALRYPTFLRHGQAGQALSQDVAHGRRSVHLRKLVSYEQVEVG